VPEIFAMIRGLLFSPNAAIALAKLITFVPVLPDLVAGAIACALTSAIGELSDRYFRTGRTMSAVEMKASFGALFKGEFQRAYRERRNELKAMFRSSQVRQEIGDLKRARRNGRMGVDEVARRTVEILDRHEQRSA
jgi:hypothetical protein